MRARLSLLLAAGGLLTPAAGAQSLFASEVVDYRPGPLALVTQTSNVLGGPSGGGLLVGSLDVLSLGTGGSVTLGFEVQIQDLPGADLTVFENGFLVAGSADVFAEVAFVEVSTDGAAWARFPSSYGPPLSGGTPIGTYAGLSGGTPVLADALLAPDSPFDPATSGGEPFDLADLAADPAVLAGQVDLSAIHFVRLVDVAPGDVDTAGTPIEVPGVGGSDFDAVAVLHHAGQAGGQPVCDLELDGQGYLTWRLGDPDGVFDLNVPTLTATVSLNPLPWSVLLSLFELTGFDGTVYEFRSKVPVQGSGYLATLALSVRDLGGNVGGDQVVLQL